MKRKFISIFIALVLALSLCLVTAVPVAAADLSVPVPYATIQDAIDAAGPNDTINVAAGTYSENVRIPVDKTGLKLLGADKATTTIDGGGSGIVVAITADAVTVSGFTITGSGSSLVDGGVFLDGVTDCTIEDNIVSGLAGMGIVLELANVNTIRNNTLELNHIAGIALFGSTGNTIKANVSTGAISTDIGGNTTGYGIWLDYSPPGQDDPPHVYSTGNAIDRNTFSNNDVDGVYFGEYSNLNTLTNNFIQDNGVAGGADGNGIFFWNPTAIEGGNTVTGNTITGNYASGMELMKSKDNTITHNTITGNNIGKKDKCGGLRIRTTDKWPLTNVVNYNNISGNHVYGIWAHADAATDATYNWWGDADGPTHTSNPDGEGDVVSDYVEFAAWLDSPFDTSPGPVTLDVNNSQITGISVTPTSIHFGTLLPGQDSAVTVITVSNTGTVHVSVDTEITEDARSFFTDNLWLDEVLADDYSDSLDVGVSTLTPGAQVRVPSDYSAVGEVTGTLLFIASGPGP